MPVPKKHIFNAVKKAASATGPVHELPAWGLGYSQQKDGTILVPWSEESENLRKKALEDSFHRHTVVQKPFQALKPLKFSKKPVQEGLQ